LGVKKGLHPREVRAVLRRYSGCFGSAQSLCCGTCPSFHSSAWL